jgi:hypothetical protein
MEQEKVKIK